MTDSNIPYVPLGGLPCPVCGNPYVTLNSMFYNGRQMLDLFDELTPSSVESRVIGRLGRIPDEHNENSAVITLSLQCGRAHLWHVNFWLHKGEVGVEIAPIVDAPQPPSPKVRWIERKTRIDTTVNLRRR